MKNVENWDTAGAGETLSTHANTKLATTQQYNCAQNNDGNDTDCHEGVAGKAAAWRCTCLLHIVGSIQSENHTHNVAHIGIQSDGRKNGSPTSCIQRHPKQGAAPHQSKSQQEPSCPHSSPTHHLHAATQASALARDRCVQAQTRAPGCR
jgi:hypothetical protein